MRRLLNRFWFRWFVFAPLATFAVLASIYTVAFYWVRSQGVAKRDPLVAKLDAEEPNWRTVALTNERNAKLPPPEENAAELAWVATEKIPKAVLKSWQKPSDPWIDLKSPHLPAPGDIRELRKELLHSRQALAVVRPIRDLPGGGFPLVFNESSPLGTLLPKIQNLRQSADLLRRDALVRAYDLDGKGALEDGRAMLAIANGIGDEPTLISQLVRMAIDAIGIGSTERTLSWCECQDDAELARIGAAFAREAEEPRLYFGLRGERASLFRVMESFDSGEIDDVDFFGRKPWIVRTLESPLKSMVPEQQALLLEYFEKALPASRLKRGPESTVIFDDLERIATRHSRDVRYSLLNMLLPAFSKLHEADTRCIANCRAAAVGIACERHRLKTSAFPDTLAELPKELLASIPDDPYTGKPILYKRLPDGCVVYSVGKDLRDDGGAELNNHQFKGNFDIGFRLWNKEARRQKPLPKEEKPVSIIESFSPGEEVKPSVTTPPPLAPIEKE